MADDDDYKDDYEDEEDEHDEEEDEEDELLVVGVFMAFGREGCDEVFDAISKVCDANDLNVLCAHPNDIVGSPPVDEVIHGILDHAHFAIIDLTHERPSVNHEVGLADRTLDWDYILLIAREGTERFSNIQGRVIHYYKDVSDLIPMLERQLNAMLERWDADNEDVEEDEEEDDDDYESDDD